MHHETRYAKSDGIHIAWQVIGHGPIDLVFVMGWVSNIEMFWREPRFVRFLDRLASFSRLIVFDKRGTGLSDRPAHLPTLEERMDDVRAVMDAAVAERAALLGVSEGGSMSALFAATYPERTAAVVLFGGYARRAPTPEYPWAPTSAERDRFAHHIERCWGTDVRLGDRAPSLAGDERFRAWWADYPRMSATPGAADVIAPTRNRSLQTMPTWKPDPSFYPTPRSAMKAPVETQGYVVQVNPTDDGTPDMIRVIDLDSESKT